MNLMARKQDIIKRKLQDTFKSNQYRIAVEDIINLLNILFESQNNPAFKAAMITALRESKALDKILKEYNDPSFEFPVNNPDYKPAKFTKNYQASQNFIENSDVSQIPDTSNHTFPIKILNITHNRNPFAKIVL